MGSDDTVNLYFHVYNLPKMPYQMSIKLSLSMNIVHPVKHIIDKNLFIIFGN